MLRWPGRNLGFDVVSVMVPREAKLNSESNAAAGGRGTPVAQKYGVILTCQVPSNNAGACDRPKPSSAAAGPDAVEIASAARAEHTIALMFIILSSLMARRDCRSMGRKDGRAGHDASLGANESF